MMSFQSIESRCSLIFMALVAGKQRKLWKRVSLCHLMVFMVGCDPGVDEAQDTDDGNSSDQQSDNTSEKTSGSSNDDNSDTDSASSDATENDEDSDSSNDDDDDSDDPSDPESDEGSVDSEDDLSDSDSNESDSNETDSDDDEETGDESEGDTGDETGDTDDEIDWQAEMEHVFPQDRIVNISLNFPSGDLNAMVEDWNSKQVKTEFGAAFDFDGKEMLENVGARLKGYSSLLFGTGQNPGGKIKTTDKLPIKINFDSQGGPRFHHFDKLSLSNLVFDPSAMRDRLTVRMFSALGVPVPAISHATLKLDDKLVGVYAMIENVDKRFLKRNFGTDEHADDGNLYKCVAQHQMGPDRSKQVCLLEWRGDRKSDYYKTTGCETGYDECGLVLKTNEDDSVLNDYSDLIHFLDVLHNSPTDEFEMEFQEVFDVDGFLRLMAVNIVLVNFDSYFGRINNYYLYHRPDTDKFMMIPWDLNMAYGGYGCKSGSATDLTQFSIDDPVCRSASTSQSYPLVDKILEVASFRSRYEAYVDEFVEKHFTRSIHDDLVGQFDEQISASLEVDPNFQFSMEKYRTAISDEMSQPKPGGYGEYNLLDFVERRNIALSR